MCERLAALLVTLTLIGSPACAEPAPAVALIDLPFKVEALRGSDSEVAISVATSGLVAMAGPKPARAGSGKDATAQADSVAVVWGPGGGAVLGLTDTGVTASLVGAEAIAAFAAAETPADAVPGSRRAQAGAITATFTGSSASGRAQAITIRERQPIGVTAEPKSVPIAVTTVRPGADAAFVADRPWIATVDGRPMVLALTTRSDGAATVALLSKRDAAWGIQAETQPEPRVANGGPPVIAGIDDAEAHGPGHITVLYPQGESASLALWTLKDGTVTRTANASGYAVPGAPGRSVPAALLPRDGPGAGDLAILSQDRTALVILALGDGLRERARIPLPATATGLAVLGRGAAARVLVGLADGRLASVAPSAGATGGDRR